MLLFLVKTSGLGNLVILGINDITVWTFGLYGVGFGGLPPITSGTLWPFWLRGKIAPENTG